MDGRRPDTARELDLLARIMAQQNRLREARHCWEAALQIAPNNETYRNGLKRIGQVERFIKLRRQIALFGGGVLIVATLVALTVKLLSSRPHRKSSQPVQRPQLTAPTNSRPSPQTAPVHAPPPPSQPKPKQPTPPQPSPNPQSR
jgi:hypothetical protein